MKRFSFTIAATAASLLFAAAPAGAQPRLVERGQYLVNAIGGCNDCHSPRDRKGALIPGRELTGAPLAFAPTAPMPWKAIAPRIRGLPAGWTEAQFVSFLQTGVKPDGSRPLPPMPEFRLNTADARAMTAYLRSLR